MERGDAETRRRRGRRRDSNSIFNSLRPSPRLCVSALHSAFDYLMEVSMKLMRLTFFCLAWAITCPSLLGADTTAPSTQRAPADPTVAAPKKDSGRFMQLHES